ncbi:replication initiator protein A [Rhizobium mongolense]|uniref:16S rRNA C967 or C1407 C5-methylase (RsmB/RsmF family) n=2 Tax=Rhizobium mongolense TaxID=57676 RepID=A0ABR6IGP7_9HYPH|nr:replication initiator protein A [Rhizobium mongolense]MBB4226759.1 16S rRNA C967 or C1407 C5-methylase (RsmB/RsmF family) [Rhizobium mongolense]TVZ73983.1 replication initiator protein A [Rhizobium mongolense USDA 1844]
MPRRAERCHTALPHRRGQRPQAEHSAPAEILKFCRLELGGNQYEDLERALARLPATNIRITNLKGSREGRDRRATETFPLIGRYKVVSRTNQDRVDQVETEIPGSGAPMESRPS